ncbi:MAG: AAA family ATPase, partial [Bacteroidia bacterium]|nr:AAA family ATPase [Bacteroidia bacterium]
MIKTDIYSAEHIADKQQLLESARQQLKKEFIGIDGIIDSVIKSIATWFIFPEIQERPLVVNLWGLTGVGKTALILRLSALLHYEKKIFRFDMGDSHKDAGLLKDRLKNIFKNKNKAPFMLMMDEFQYAKTKNEDGFEINNP